jgi:hypothetical protein
VPPILTRLLAPLFDAHMVDIESHVLYAPDKMETFDGFSISVSIFVLPALFLWAPPVVSASGAGAQSSLGDHPLWRRVLAKKERDLSATGAASHSGCWNPVEAFVRLLRECEVQPVSGQAETALDESDAAEAVMSAAPTASGGGGGAAAVDVSMDEGGDVHPTAVEEEEEVDPLLSQPRYAEEDEVLAEEARASTAAASASSSTHAHSSAAASSAGRGAPAAASSSPSAAPAAASTISRAQLTTLYASASRSTLSLPECPEPPGLRTTLRPYQRQALYWMIERERSDEEKEQGTRSQRVQGRQTPLVEGAASGGDVADSPAADSAPKRMHPLWERYAFGDDDSSHFYLNPFSHELTLDFPPATGSCRGGLLCDEMGAMHRGRHGMLR